MRASRKCGRVADKVGDLGSERLFRQAATTTRRPLSVHGWPARERVHKLTHNISSVMNYSVAFGTLGNTKLSLNYRNTHTPIRRGEGRASKKCPLIFRRISSGWGGNHGLSIGCLGGNHS